MANTELIESGKVNRLYAFFESKMDPMCDDGGPNVRFADVSIARQLHLAPSGDYTGMFTVDGGDPVECYIEVVSESSREKDYNTKNIEQGRWLTPEYILVYQDGCCDPRVCVFVR